MATATRKRKAKVVAEVNRIQCYRIPRQSSAAQLVFIARKCKADPMGFTLVVGDRRDGWDDGAKFTPAERLLEKLRAQGVEVRSFDGWKDTGKWVKRGERRKAFRVQSGSRRYEVPGTGEERYEPIYKTAYGFTADQVK
jgi:hypothetical protein